ncbi:cytochrome d ubiquinol oxidase subunit II [Candidatus Nitronereus thalassa]|uniref:Cytochrome d ubiquinol oxidase subunit II n=1 Tax=Candidatus Nitronereus thalassa TaxID=3020898 RepID=A0ABU3K861_9BACT|nr:cytochrome d ubiquinol oxidase subunit II [Candidatus Nitronereus thalassa]MDT7042547.1 cytochrome d ubiquinol oxidase subunit II [Candidatus Nitronereus thalassa]
MIGYETILGIVLLLALTFYALMGGADFGAGVWHLLARGKTRRNQHQLIGEAIGPIWEANHVWLILVVTILFTAFPPAYAQVSITLHIPLTLLVIGIVLRGSAYAFRHYDVKDDDVHLRWDQIFALSSLISPLLLGIILGSVTAGNFPVKPESFFEGFVAPWIQPFPLVMGVFTLVLFAYLAASYLLLETQDLELQELFRKRAIASVLIAGVLEELVMLLGKTGAPRLWGELTNSLWGGFLQIGMGSLTLVAIALLVTRRYWWARTCAIVQVTITILAWGIAQSPYLVPPYLTIFNASSPEVMLRLIVIALFTGALLLFPSLLYLFKIFKGGTLFGVPKKSDG